MSHLSTERILIVDDAPEIRELLVEAVRSEGYLVDQAGNGAEALAYLAQRDCNCGLVIIDVMMPLMSGIEFRRRQRAEPSLAHSPVLFITASELVGEIGETL